LDLLSINLPDTLSTRWVIVVNDVECSFNSCANHIFIRASLVAFLHAFKFHYPI
jgi:hypothetical protein